MKNSSTNNYENIKKTLADFIKDTTAPYNMIEPWVIINKYFTIDNSEPPIVYLNVWNTKYSLWEHSTLDISDARNFIIYMRVLCNNLIVWPIKYENP